MPTVRLTDCRTARGGESKTITLDQRSRDRLEWCQRTARELLGVEAGTSVLLRAALDHYTVHLEALLRSPDEAGKTRASLTLSVAARGTAASLPIDALLAIPPRPFSDIEKEHAERTGAEQRAKLQAFLRGEAED